MTMPPISYTDANGVFWHKSTHSGSDNGCIEHGMQPSGDHGVRDTKDPKRKTMLAFKPEAWEAFVSATKQGLL